MNKAPFAIFSGDDNASIFENNYYIIKVLAFRFY